MNVAQLKLATSTRDWYCLFIRQSSSPFAKKTRKSLSTFRNCIMPVGDMLEYEFCPNTRQVTNLIFFKSRKY
jgi:hypothetical protein